MKVSREHIDRVRASDLFDGEWYSHENPEVQFLGMDPAEHFVLFGRRLGRKPSPEFSAGTDLNGSSDSLAALLGYSSIPRPRPISIVIPIYNAYEETKACLASVIRWSPKETRVILINDCSPDSRIKSLLDSYEEQQGFEIYHNEKNLGFTKTVNRGLRVASSDDVILLNSDTVVTPRFVSNLKRAAYSKKRVGTATPFSNNSGAFSAPKFNENNPIPSGFTLDEFARLVTRQGRRLYPEVPTGHGFCMYIRRAYIDDVGLLDEEAFPRGYGEENDFCMRGSHRGWRHLIDDATYIYHVRSVSFGDEKKDLIKAGRAVLDQRYPDYAERIRSFREDPKIKKARELVGEATRAAPVGVLLKPRIVFVTSTRTGGTPQTNEDLMRALQDRYETFLLRCDAKTIYFYRFDGKELGLLEESTLREPIEGFPHTSAGYDQRVRAILDTFNIDLLHVRHIAWHSLGLLNVAKELDIPIVFSFHDFYTICPTVKLLDERNVFCGGVCTSTKGECKHELWSDQNFPALKHAGIHVWQRFMKEAISLADAYVTTSDHARQIVSNRFGEAISKKLYVIPHGRDLEMLPVPHVTKRRPLKILVLGNINRQKGSEIIASVAAADRGRFLEFHVLGQTELKAGPGLHVYGKYNRADLPELIARIEPDIGAVLSIWPETFCHTLTEMWAAGLGVAAFDLGAVGERLRKTQNGWLLPSLSPASVLREFQRIAADGADRKVKAANVASWQRSEGRTNSTIKMSLAYDSLYRHLLLRPRASLPLVLPERPRVGLIVPSVGAASTQIRILQKTKDGLNRAIRYDLLEEGSDTPGKVLSEYSAVIVQRTALATDKVGSFLAACKDAKVKVLYELDDDLLNVKPSDGETVDYNSIKPGIRELLRGADGILTSTNEIALRYKDLNSEIFVSPNGLDEELWFRPLNGSAVAPPARTEDEYRVLYMGSRTHEKDLELIAEACRAFKERCKDARFFMIGGAKRVPDWAEPIAVPDEYKIYSRFVPWFRAVAMSMDLGLAPLEDTVFNRAKSPLKLYEYAAAGLPGLFSDVEPYHSAVKQGGVGRLVQNTTNCWLSALQDEMDKRAGKITHTIERLESYASENHSLRKQASEMDNFVMRQIGGVSGGI